MNVHQKDLLIFLILPLDGQRGEIFLQIFKRKKSRTIHLLVFDSKFFIGLGLEQDLSDLFTN